MADFKIVFIIDKVELQYFELNELVTSFWLIKECNERSWDVFITTADKLSLNNNIPQAQLYKTKLVNKNGKLDLVREKDLISFDLNNFDVILFRPDPPVDIDYIISTYILDYVDQHKTILLNSPSGIRAANEKLYINNFPFAAPPNISTSSITLLKEFLNEHKEIIVKPLNKCFGKGVFYLKKGDSNTNSILETATNNSKSVIMAQKYISKAKEGDKRIIIIGGKVYEEAIIKISGEGDFKFNAHKDEFIKKGFLTQKEREICNKISHKLLQDGLFLVGLDIIDNKIIEINVTSPCFFIKEINSMFNTKLEVRIVDYIESLINSKTPNSKILSPA